MNGWGVTFHHRRWTMMDCHIESCRVQLRQVDGSHYSFTSVFSEAFCLDAPEHCHRILCVFGFYCTWLSHVVAALKVAFFARPQAELCLYCCCVNNGTNRFSLKRASIGGHIVYLVKFDRRMKIWLLAGFASRWRLWSDPLFDRNRLVKVVQWGQRYAQSIEQLKGFSKRHLSSSLNT